MSTKDWLSIATPPRHGRREARRRGMAIVRGGERLHQRMREFRPDVVHFHNLVTGVGQSYGQRRTLARRWFSPPTRGGSASSASGAH